MLLDDILHISRIDKGNMMERIRSLPQQIKDTLETMASLNIPHEYSNCKYVVAVGMGGSGIPGDFLKTIYRQECTIPIFVHKDYSLPAFVDDKALVLAVSYSGTTEETIDAYLEALRRRAKIFGISSGDQLLELLRKNGVPHFAPPAGRTTRECIGYLLFSMIKVLERSGCIPQQDSNIQATISRLELISSTYAPEIPTSNNKAKEMALRLYNKMPVLYGSTDLTDVVALRWKQQINENSKAFAQLEVFPDVTHNQLAAIANPGQLDRDLVAIVLRNVHERPELRRRIDAATEVVRGKGIDLIEHWAEEQTLLVSILSQSYVGDFVSLYLAVLNGVDPTPTTAMSELKRLLGLTDLSPT